MTRERKEAKIMALQNAAEFIRQHGEEGGIDDSTFDAFSAELYLKEAKKVAAQLSKQATALIAYLNTNTDKK